MADDPTLLPAVDLPELGRPCRTWGALPPAPRVAIVGSRAAHKPALEAVPALVAAVHRAGFAVVSGGARGIDAAVHRAALARGVPQVAVLPLGPEQPYPPEHGPLFAAIARARAAPSAVLFPIAPGVPASRGAFASRNRHVVALADAVIVAQAEPGSGSEGTGRLALAAGRPLAVLLGSRGGARLLARGATALVAGPTLADDVEAWLTRAPAPRGWPAELAWLGERLRAEGVLDLGRAVDGAALALPLLRAEAEGLAVAVAPGRWIASSEAGVSPRPSERSRGRS